MRPGKEMLLSIPLIFILTSSGVNAQNATEVTETQLTSADCLAYVYVTWIFFVYSIGLGAEERDYPQVLSRAYALVPSQCGGYFTSSPVIPPTTMLSLLITTMSSTTTTTTMTPSFFNLFPSLFLGNGARGGLSSIDSVRGGLGRNKKIRKNRDSVFKEGMNKMAGQPMTKYIAQLGRPVFKADGSIELDLNNIKERKGRRFCRDLAMSMKDMKKICKRIRKMRKMGQKKAGGSRKKNGEKGKPGKGRKREQKTKRKGRKNSAESQSDQKQRQG